MLRQSFALVTAPATEPVTLAEAKAYCHLDTDDEDALLDDLITSARQAAEEYLRRSLVTQTWKLTLDLCPDRDQWWEGVRQGPLTDLYGNLPQSVPLPKGPVQSITSVTTYDLNNAAAVFASSNYRVDASGDRLILNYGPSGPAASARRPGARSSTSRATATQRTYRSPSRPASSPTSPAYTSSAGSATTPCRWQWSGSTRVTASWGTALGSCCDNPATKLKKRVTIQNPVLVSDGQGGFTETWVDAATVWASLDPYKGWERFQASQLATPITYKVMMRYTTLLTTRSRLVYGDRYFGVKEAINQNEDNRFLDIRAVELESVDAGNYDALLHQGGGYIVQQGGGRILLGL